MTVEDAILEVYEGSNEQDDLSPYANGAFSLATTGAQKILAAFARGAKILSTWKFGNGFRLRFRVLEQEDFVSSYVISGYTSQASYPTYTMLLQSNHNGSDNAFRGMLFTLDGIDYTIIASTAEEVTLAMSIDVAPTSAAYTIAKRDYAYGVAPDWALTHRPVEFIDIYDVTNQAAVESTTEFERFSENSQSSGTPAQFTRSGSSLRFDVFPTAVAAYRVRYIRYAQIGTEAESEICDLPQAFHEPLCEWVRHWALNRDGDFTAASVSWQAFVSLMQSLRLQADFINDYEGRRLSQDR
jgi:hypothetical protein